MSTSIENKAVVGIVWSLMQRFGGMFVSFVTNVILARILTPDDFGVIGMLLIFLAIANTFVDGGFTSALIQKKNPTERDYSTIFYWNLLLSFVFVVILYVSAPLIAGFYRMPILVDVLRVQSWILIINALYNVQANILIKRLQFKRYALINLFATIIGSICAIIFAFCDFGVWSLVCKNLLSSFVMMIIIWFLSDWRPIRVFDIKSFKALGGFGVMVLFSNLIETIYTEMQGLVIGRVYSAKELGFYTQAKRLEEIPTLGLTSAINQVSFPLYSQLQEQLLELKKMLRKNMQILSYINMPLYFILILVAQPLIVLLFSEKWIASISYFQILCFAGMIYPLMSVNTNIIKSLGKGKLYFYLQFGKRMIGILLICFCSRFGMECLMWILVFIAFIMYVVNVIATKYLLHYSYQEHFEDVFPSFLNACVVFIFVYFVSLFVECNQFLLMFLQILIYGVLYVLLSAILKISGFKYILSLCKIKKHENN